MAPEQNDARTELRRTFGTSRPPERITQQACNPSGKHLNRLVRLASHEKPDPDDLWQYLQDIRHCEIQGDLLGHLLPLLLEVWREDLHGSHGYGGLIEHLYPLLANTTIFASHLKPKQTAAVSDFMRRSVLEEIDNQQGLNFRGSRAEPYRWFSALASYGVLFPNIEVLWSDLWALGTHGRALSTLQYASCLIYPENENPVFAPWTPNEGGGPPCLWDYAGHLYEHCCLQPNVESLKSFLTPSKIRDSVARAVALTEGQPEYSVALDMISDLPILFSTLEARCGELPKILATVQPAGRLVSWSH